MKSDIVIGSSTVEDYFAWINERHRIYTVRDTPWPWTEDPILQKFKFTNVFRQLDRGTVALNNALEGKTDAVGIMRNIWVYRLHNLDQIINEYGYVDDLQDFLDYWKKRKAAGKKCFTSAFMTTGRPFEDKVVTYSRAMVEAWDNAVKIRLDDMQTAWKSLLPYYMVGKFLAYEIVCDMRFHLFEPDDVMTWANPGPGAIRGLKRLGMIPKLQSMIDLLQMAPDFLSPQVKSCRYPFELREIEHCLCEFDKYERARTGVGRPKENYHP